MVAHRADGETPAEKSDERMDFLRDFILRALRLKPDKWDRMLISDEQRHYIVSFIERGHPQVCKKNLIQLKFY